MNPRPSVRNQRFYMLSRSFDLTHYNPADRARNGRFRLGFNAATPDELWRDLVRVDA